MQTLIGQTLTWANGWFRIELYKCREIETGRGSNTNSRFDLAITISDYDARASDQKDGSGFTKIYALCMGIPANLAARQKG